MKGRGWRSLSRDWMTLVRQMKLSLRLHRRKNKNVKVYRQYYGYTHSHTKYTEGCRRKARDRSIINWCTGGRAFSIKYLWLSQFMVFARFLWIDRGSTEEVRYYRCLSRTWSVAANLSARDEMWGDVEHTNCVGYRSIMWCDREFLSTEYLM